MELLIKGHLSKVILGCLVLLLVNCEDSSNSEITEFYNNGKRKVELLFKNDKPYLEIHYYQSGGKKRVFEVQDGIRNGKVVAFFENGDTLGIANVKNDKLNGLFLEFSSNGVIVRELEYDHDSLMVFRKFNSDGQKFFEIDSRNEITRTWHKNGQLHGVSPRNGQVESYYLSGQKEYTGEKQDHQRLGTWQYWDSLGVLLKEVKYEDGLAIDSVVFLE
jgi:antitoxin component YwqK of YwqJK toxin-antitoxin module